MLQTIMNRRSRVNGAKIPGNDAGFERRQSHRLYLDLSVEFRVIFHGPDHPLICRGKIRNISQGGAFLECNPQTDITLGQVGHFTLTSLPGRNEASATHLAAKAIVRRIEHPAQDRALVGVALEFLSGPLLFYQETSLRS